MCIFSSFCCGGKPLIRASICRSARVAAREGRNAFGKWDDPNSTNLYSQPTQPSSKKFSKPYTELITSVIAKTEIVWAPLLVCPTVQSNSLIGQQSGDTLAKSSQGTLPAASLNWPLKAWQQNIGTKASPPNMLLSSILLLAWQHTTSKYLFLKILNHQFPRVLSHLVSSFLAAAVAESIEMHFSCYCPPWWPYPTPLCTEVTCLSSLAHQQKKNKVPWVLAQD